MVHVQLRILEDDGKTTEKKVALSRVPVAGDYIWDWPTMRGLEVGKVCLMSQYVEHPAGYPKEYSAVIWCDYVDIASIR